MSDVEGGLVVLVDDDDVVRAAVAQSLDLAGFTVLDFGGAREALARLTPQFPGAVVTDISMPEIDGLQLFASIREIDPGIPVILMTGHGNVPMAVRALKDGADDFLAKPFATDHLVASVQRGLHRRALELENRRLRDEVDAAGRRSPLIGESPAIVAIRDRIRQVAEADVAVLIEGETGVGKELLARLIHGASQRRGAKFVTVDCGTLAPETGVELLFGTPLGRANAGEAKLAQAHRGTLFLDAVERLPAALQPAVLSVLEESAAVGSGASAYPVDARVIAASRADLRDALAQGTLAADLYYALDVARFRVPPLRERRADIPLLFVHFLEEAARQLKRASPRVTDALRRHLLEHDWPGNVRELRSFAFQVCAGIQGADVAASADQPILADRVASFEAAAIRATLEECKGNAAQAMERLGTPRKTFYDKLARHGIDIGKYRV